MTIEQKFNEEFQKRLLEKIIDFNPSNAWHKHASDALNHASPMSLGIDAKDFMTLVESKPSKLNCYHFALLNNNLENTSAHQLGLSLFEYAKLMVETGKYQQQWKELTDGMKDEVMVAIMPKEMKAVKAEA